MNEVIIFFIIIMHIKWQWLYNKEYKNYKKLPSINSIINKCRKNIQVYV